METEELKKLLKPYLCEDKVRVGSVYDGGYILPASAIKNAGVLLSFGVSTNIDFEKEMAALNPALNIYMYDPFIGVLPDLKRLILRITGKTVSIRRDIKLPLNDSYKNPPGLISDTIGRFFHWRKFYGFIAKKNIHFYKTGLRDYNDKMFTSFPEMFSKPFLKDKRNIIVKMDIEGDEYKVYKQMPGYLSAIDVMLLEVHEVKDNVAALTDMIRMFKSGGLILFHVHGNNSDVLVENTSIPNTLELSFARDPYTKPVYDTASYPHATLDSPTNPKYQDYTLDFLTAFHS